MSTTITWKIEGLERTLPDGVVSTVHWRVNAQDGDYAASVYGSLGVQGSKKDKGFILFDKLTEENVISWVKENLENREEIENGLKSQIESQKEPKSASGLPWSVV